MKIKIYLYRNCSTCRKALAFLARQSPADLEEVDITQTPPALSELQGMASHLGDVRKLFNTSGQVYREMQLGKKLPTLSSSDALHLLAGNGRLVKRPFLLVDGVPKEIGFNEAAWSRLFG